VITCESKWIKGASTRPPDPKNRKCIDAAATGERINKPNRNTWSARPPQIYSSKQHCGKPTAVCFNWQNQTNDCLNPDPNNL
jgi:hypothetical protein